MRLLNLDSTRVIEVGVEGGRAALIAVDGHPLPPVALDASGVETWRMGPAMRADMLVRVPAAGGTVRIVDYFSADPWDDRPLRQRGRAASGAKRGSIPRCCRPPTFP